MICSNFTPQFIIQVPANKCPIDQVIKSSMDNKIEPVNLPIPQNPPRPYKKVNAYTKPPARQQIGSLILMIIVIVLHSIFIVPSIVSVIRDPILYFLLALFYTLLVIIVIDYFVLTVKDPVDSLVSGKINSLVQRPEDMRFCDKCGCNKFLKSYHCKSCQRCTQNFDHHCRYLNNCIGGQNYLNFIRILIFLSLYFIDIIAQCIWVFVETFQTKRLQQYMISKWPVLIVAIIVVCMILAVQSLFMYHLYLNFVRNMTTVEYVFRNTPSNPPSTQSSDELEEAGRANCPQISMQ